MPLQAGAVSRWVPSFDLLPPHRATPVTAAFASAQRPCCRLRHHL